MKTIIMYNRKKTRNREEFVEMYFDAVNNILFSKYRIVTCRGAPTACMVMFLPEKDDSVLEGIIRFGISRCHKNDTFSKKKGRSMALKNAHAISQILEKYPGRPRDKFWHSPDFKMGHAPLYQLPGVIAFFRKLETFTRKAEHEKHCRESNNGFRRAFPGIDINTPKIPDAIKEFNEPSSVEVAAALEAWGI